MNTDIDINTIRKALQLKVMDDSRSIARNLTFNWTADTFRETTLELYLDFDVPLLVSQGVRVFVY